MQIMSYCAGVNIHSAAAHRSSGQLNGGPRFLLQANREVTLHQPSASRRCFLRQIREGRYWSEIKTVPSQRSNVLCSRFCHRLSGALHARADRSQSLAVAAIVLFISADDPDCLSERRRVWALSQPLY